MQYISRNLIPYNLVADGPSATFHNDNWWRSTRGNTAFQKYNVEDMNFEMDRPEMDL